MEARSSPPISRAPAPDPSYGASAAETAASGRAKAASTIAVPAPASEATIASRPANSIARPRMRLRSATRAALPPLGGPRGQLKRTRLAQRHDLFDRYPVARLEPGLFALAPDDASDNDMVTAAKFDHRAARNLAGGSDHEPPRRDVEDAGIAP